MGPGLRRHAGPAAAALLGLAAFLVAGGWAIVDPRRVDWMGPGTDAGYHYLGWLFFRDAPLALHPLGAIPGYQYPAGTTVGFTDALPWIALPLRLLAPLLPHPFQYQGLWLLLCYVLTAWSGARLVRAAAPAAGPWTVALGGTLLVLAPVLMLRLRHEALCSHFLLLEALALGLRPSPRAPRLAPVLLTALAIGIHPYLAAMVVVLAAAALIRARAAGALASWAGAAGLMALVVGVYLVLAVWLGFLGPGVPGLAARGFGDYAVDLLAFVNPARTSWYLPALPEHTGVAEGGYLGLGALVLGASALGVALHARRAGAPPLPFGKAAPALAAASLLAVYAASPRLTALGTVLVDLSPLYAPLGLLTGAFRASGRFLWPLGYLVVAGAIAIWARRRPRAAPWMLAACIVLQLIEVRGLIFVARFQASFPGPRFAGEWQLARGDYEHFALYPPRCADATYPCCGTFTPRPRRSDLYLAELVAELGLTLNSGGVARAFREKMQVYCDALAGDVLRGQLDPRTIYQVAPEAEAPFRAANPAAPCRPLDGALTCVAPAARGPFRAFLARGR